MSTTPTRPPVEGTDGYLFEVRPPSPPPSSVPDRMGAMARLCLGDLAFTDTPEAATPAEPR